MGKNIESEKYESYESESLLPIPIFDLENSNLLEKKTAEACVWYSLKGNEVPRGIRGHRVLDRWIR
jgi:hypothetical protein